MSTAEAQACLVSYSCECCRAGTSVFCNVCSQLAQMTNKMFPFTHCQWSLCNPSQMTQNLLTSLFCEKSIMAWFFYSHFFFSTFFPFPNNRCLQCSMMTSQVHIPCAQSLAWFTWGLLSIIFFMISQQLRHLSLFAAESRIAPSLAAKRVNVSEWVQASSFSPSWFFCCCAGVSNCNAVACRFHCPGPLWAICHIHCLSVHAW